MLNKLLYNKQTFFTVIVFVILLIGVRAMENKLFYDPFLEYFEGDYLNAPLPHFNFFQLSK